MNLSLFLLLATAAMAAASLHATSPNPDSYHETNEDGTVTPLIRLIGRGEPGGQVVEETVDGFTVDRINGNYKYMEVDDATGYLIDSGLQAGVDNPNTKVGKSGQKLQKKARGKKWVNNEDTSRRISEIEEANGIPEDHRHNFIRRTAAIGNKKNLVVLFKFSDHTGRTVPNTSDISVLMNNQGTHTLCPTGSVRDVYLQSSFGQLVLDSTIADWVTLPNTEAYYGGGNSAMGTKAHEMIRDALNALDATGFDFTPFDTDADGYVDAIAFLHSGYGAEWGGTDAYGTPYTNRIWSHKWSLYSLPNGKWTSNDGVSVYNYHVSPSVWSTSGSAIGRIGVIAHETGHYFGLPDLYDGNDSDGNGIAGSGIGSFGLMANSWGFDSSQYYPPHMSAWSKIQLGWVTPTVITAPGTYSIRQACDYPDVFLINTNFPSGEYLLIENRQKCDFDAKIAGPGLAIFHIDDTTGYTTEGFPGQTGWPTNGNHYRVALLQADGGYDLEKGSDRGDGTDLFFGGGVTSIGPSGTSAGAANPNTKAYQAGVVLDTGITISNISAPGATMTFTVTFGAGAPVPTPVAAPVPAPTAPVPAPTAPITAPTAPITAPTAAKPTPTKPTLANPTPTKPTPTKPTPTKPTPTKPTPTKPTPTATPPTAPVAVTSNTFTLVLQTDMYGKTDTAWSLTRTSPNGPTVVASKAVGSYAGSTLYTEYYTVDSGASYQFTITDVYGDGICCSYGAGYYTIKLGGTVLKTGGSFGSSETTTFSVA